MRYLKMCCLAPHPPIIIPEVGGREVDKIQSSVGALERVSRDIEDLNPETLVVMSPHSAVYRDGFAMMAGGEMAGSLRQFGAPGVRIGASADGELAEAIEKMAASRGIPVIRVDGGSKYDSNEVLDHGVLVPLYYLAPDSYELVCISLSFLDYWDHYQLGIAIREAVQHVERDTVFVASGDLSHRLTPEAPAGYSPKGEVFDKAIEEILSEADFKRLFTLDSKLVDDAGECGLRPIFTLAGTVDGYEVRSEVLSYEGPFGVGYMVAEVKPGEPDPARRIVPGV